MAEFASKGVAGSGLGLGIAGTALGILNGGLGNILGGAQMCAENQYINRYELEMENKIVSKDSEIALLKSNIYTDQKLNDLRNYVDAKFGVVEASVNAQAVYNATKTSGQFSFEERMGCGFGACMGCSCKTKYGNKRICIDGPVLVKEEIIW